MIHTGRQTPDGSETLVVLGLSEDEVKALATTTQSFTLNFAEYGFRLEVALTGPLNAANLKAFGGAQEAVVIPLEEMR